MAERIFTLPGINDLSKEQETARSLRFEEQHLIVGGPGTGKSVIALLRAARLARENRDYVFLVYNKLLHKASQQLADTRLTSSTWITWFKQQFNLLTGSNCPTKENPWELNWEETLDIINKTELQDVEQADLPYLVIDEGQDMPPQFYTALINLGFGNFFVVADQNQQITEENSSIKDIRNALAIETDDVIELKYNYRNSYPIARLAREFYTSYPASPPPDLPPEDSFALKPLVFEYHNSQQAGVINRIMTLASNDLSKLVGIITPKNDVLKQYLDLFVAARERAEFRGIRLSAYASGSLAEFIENIIGDITPSFEEGGILLINAQACKGLEFDTVFIVDLQEHYFNLNIMDIKKKLFYVMVARAIDRLIMLKRKESYCPVCHIIPKDPDILEWK